MDTSARGRNDAGVCEQVKTLLGGPEVARAFQPVSSESAGGKARAAQPVGRRVLAAAWGLAAAVVAVACVIGGFFWLKRPPASAPISAQHAGAGTRPPTAEKPAPAISDKSLVVLPLENLSPDPENAFFTDGMHAEIIATLSRIPDLKVISRDSAVALKGSPLSLAEKARRVGVVNVLTGSVRREGDRVRVQLELRRAADESLLWSSPKADRALTDRLALQDEIASEVARALQAREARGTYASAQFMTSSPAAFELFNKAGWTRANSTDAIRLLEEALQLDPQFMTAASALSREHYTAWLAAADDVARQRHMAESKKWAEVASRLVPGGAGDSALSHYYAMMEFDNPRALQLIDGALRALPNEALNHNRRGLALQRLGRLAESVPAYERSIELDPLNSSPWLNLLNVFAFLRRPDEFNRVVSDGPARIKEVGSDHGRFVVSGELPSQPRTNVAAQIDWLMKARRLDEALKLSEANPATASQPVRVRFGSMVQRTMILLRMGRTAEGQELGRTLVLLAKELEAAPEFDQSERERRTALALAFSGRHAESIATMKRYVAACSPVKRTAELWSRRGQLAELHAQFSQPRDAVEIIKDLLRVPSGLTVPMLKVDPTWDNVREDPAFKALLADPKNSAPL
ncbi:MAG: tetratricopeptide repeat protein [Opitutus sp.]|nr:tetratricopeptide repeat protein [Opitutus sp.]